MKRVFTLFCLLVLNTFIFAQCPGNEVNGVGNYISNVGVSGVPTAADDAPDGVFTGFIATSDVLNLSYNFDPTYTYTGQICITVGFNNVLAQAKFNDGTTVHTFTNPSGNTSNEGQPLCFNYTGQGTVSVAVTKGGTGLITVDGSTFDYCVTCQPADPDADGDGVCDVEDQCPNFNDALLGSPCNDGDAATINDIYADCICAGCFDANLDGICDDAIVINEINYRNISQTSDIKFVELYNSSTASINISGWHLTNAVTYTFPAGTVVASGQYIIVAENPTDCENYFGISNTYGPYTGNLSTSGDDVELRDASFQITGIVDYESWKEWPNVRFNDNEVNDVKFPASIQRINPKMDGKHGGSWLGATPTPMAQNTGYVSNYTTLPVLKDVSKSPDFPLSGQQVVITADFDNHLLYQNNFTVQLEYQVVTPGNYIAKSDPGYQSNWSSGSMLDNGIQSDAVANDGTYSFAIPSATQVHRSLIRYRILIQINNGGPQRYFPDQNHTESNYSYYVYDGYPTFNNYNLTSLDSLPEITILTKSSTAEVYIGDGGANTNQYTGTEYLGEGTFIYNGKIFDHIRFRPRGGDSRKFRKKPGIKFDLNNEKEVTVEDDCGKDYDVDRGKLAISGTWQNDIASHGLTESLIYKVLELCEAPFYKSTDYSHLRIVDEASEAGDFWGVFLIFEDYGSDHLKEHNLPEGNINRYKPTRVAYQGDFPNSENIGSVNTSQVDYDYAKKDRIANIIYGQNGNNYYGKHSQRDFYSSETQLWFTWWGDMDNAFGSPYDDVVVFPRANSIFDTNCDNDAVIPAGPIYLEFKNELRSATDLLLNTEQYNYLVDAESAKIYNPSAAFDWTTVDRSRWNQTYDLGTVDAQMNWYKTWFQNRKNYIDTRNIDGILDAAIPNKPTISLTGSNALDNMSFSNSSFTDPQGNSTFAALEWRVGEWSDPANPYYQTKCTPRYEIQTKWKSGEITSFSNSYTIPADAQLKLERTYKIRVRYKDNTGRWSHWSDPVSIVPTPAVNYTPANLVINEIMYHAGKGCGSDFLEIYNAENSAVTLDNYKFTDGVDFDFPVGTTIPANGYIAIAKDSLEFIQQYGFSPFGDYSGSLSNDGEHIVLTAPYRTIADSLTYNDADPWDKAPDGDGPSLELLNPLSDNTDPLSWFRSDNDCGTPDAANSRVCNGAAEAIVFNEINYNSNNAVADPGDWVELHNTSASAVNISGWTFYDKGDEFVLPAGTIIAGGGFLVLVEDDAMFSSVFPHLGANQKLGNFDFSLGNGGERVSLFDENKCLSDYVVYDEEAPWPTPPDGNGPTLSLVTPNSDNALPGSWEASSNINAPFGTPGRANVPCPGPFTILSSGPYCKGDTIMFHTQPNNDVAFTWNIQGGTPATAIGDTVYAVFPNSGFVVVSLQAEFYECTSTDQSLINVIACNTAPIPQPDFYTVNEDITLTGNVLQNDTEPENQTMSTTINSNVSNGTLSLNSNGTFTYTPTLNYYGSDAFTYEVCDNASPALCATESVSITVNSVNDPPVTISDNYSGLEDSQITGNVLTNDTDVDGNTLTATVFSLPANGSVTIQANGNFTYTPTANYFGTDVFEYQVCDNGSPAICVTETVSLSISPVNDAPEAVADNYSVDEDIILSDNVLTNDSDIENNTLSATLVTNVTNGTLSLSANGSFTYTPNANYYGPDAFTYQVCDNGSPSLCVTESVTITVNPINDAPNTTNDNFFGLEDNQITGNVLTNDSDIDGDALTTTVFSSPSNGTVTLQANGSFTYTPAANYFGSDQFIYEVCDNGSPTICLTETVLFSISPVNDAPIAVTDNYSLDEDNTLSNNVLTNDSDIENNTLATILVSNVSNGTLSLQSNGSFLYTPNLNYNGSDAFSYQVCDNGSPVECATTSVSITVNPINDPPVTNPDVFLGMEDDQITGNVLSNDSDVDGNTLTTTVSSAPTNGTINLLANGNFTYTPDPDYNGSDVFEYQVCDDGTPSICLTETVTLSITPVNDAPIAVADNYSVNEDNSLSNNVLINDSDIENNTLTTTVFVDVLNGSLTLNTDGTFTYIPNANYFGSDNFIYEVCDNANPALCATAIASIVINSVNDGPSTVADNYTIAEDNQISDNVLTNDSDIDGNTLSTTISSTTTNGVVTLQTNGDFVYTPNANYFGGDAFVYEVCDNGTPSICLTENVSITVTPVNDAPIAVADVYTVNEDNTLNNDVLKNDSEVENQPMTVSLVSNTSNGNLTLNGTGDFVYIPAVNYFGTDSFSYSVCDDSTPELCTTASVTINVLPINDQPIIVNDTLSTDEGVQVAGDASTNDFDVETSQMNYLLTSFTQNGSVLFNFDGSFYYTPFGGFAGIDSFTYQACDNGTPNYCDTATVYIEVIPDCITIDIEVILEGAFDDQTGLMETTLNTVRSLLPGMINNPTSGQPYDAAPWNYNGNEGLNWSDSDYDATVVDWILVSFRAEIEKSSEILRVAALVHSDGSVSFPGNCINTQELPSSFYIVVEHRNHMIVMSPNKVSVVNRVVTWDFRNSNSFAQGGAGSKELTPGVWGMYAGDCNQIEDLVRSDIKGNDKSDWLLSNGIFGQYHVTDMNMNGDVNGADKALWLLNNGVFGSVGK